MGAFRGRLTATREAKVSETDKPIRVSDRGEDYEVHVDVANDCTIRVTCLDSSGAVAHIPRLTPFEARR